jgi:CysZ protein
MSQDSAPKNLPVRRGPGSLFTGATYPLRALKVLIEVPRLRQYVLIPILLNLVVGITIYAGLLTAGLQAIDTLLTAIPTWITHAPHPEIHWSTWTAALPHWQIALPNWVPTPQLDWPSFSWPDLWPDLTWPEWLPHLTLPRMRLPAWVDHLSEAGLAFLIWLLRLVLVITLLLVTGFILLQFGVLLGAPWYGQLSEELEKLKTGRLQTIRINPIREIWRAILYELKKLVLTLGIGILLLFCNFLPGIGTLIATTCWITLAATIICLDFLDAALERRRLRFRQKLEMIYQSLPASAGFALTCLGLVSIPFINLLAIPVCVAAGTLFACDRILPNLLIDQQQKIAD